MLSVCIVYRVLLSVEYWIVPVAEEDAQDTFKSNINPNSASNVARYDVLVTVVFGAATVVFNVDIVPTPYFLTTFKVVLSIACQSGYIFVHTVELTTQGVSEI